jgi:hypothetical protein
MAPTIAINFPDPPAIFKAILHDFGSTAAASSATA